MSDRLTAPLVIGLSGYARAGKDTVAGILADLGWEQRSFAAPLYAALYTMNPLVMSPRCDAVLHLAGEVDRIGWEAAKDLYPEVRALLQRLGTEVGRNQFGADFWVKQATHDLWEPDAPRVVFSDVRFPNEAEACKTLGGQVWRIERPGHGPANGHVSESALDGYDFDQVIVNLGTIADLAAAVNELLNGAREAV